MEDEKQLLPVGAVLPELFAALRSSGGAVLAAAPGAGKTTLVPGACLDEPEFASGRILLLEPRRVAARAAARRIASLLGEPVGRRVGYIVRGDSRYTSETRILVVTEGVLIRRIQEDPALEDTALVIFDEFHERSLDADLGLALVLDLRGALRPELKVLVMSATLETEAVSRLLGGVPVIEAPGRQFPVEQRWSAPGTLDRFHPAPAVARASAGLYREKAGDMLVFLPGMAEIEATRALLETMLPEEALLLPLHGSLSPAEQDRALQPVPPGAAEGGARHQHRRKQSHHRRGDAGGRFRIGAETALLPRGGHLLSRTRAHFAGVRRPAQRPGGADRARNRPPTLERT